MKKRLLTLLLCAVTVLCLLSAVNAAADTEPQNPLNIIYNESRDRFEWDMPADCNVLIVSVWGDCHNGTNNELGTEAAEPAYADTASKVIFTEKDPAEAGYLDISALANSVLKTNSLTLLHRYGIDMDDDSCAFSMHGWYRVRITVLTKDRYGAEGRVDSEKDFLINRVTENFPRAVRSARTVRENGQLLLTWDPSENAAYYVVTAKSYNSSRPNQTYTLGTRQVSVSSLSNPERPALPLDFVTDALEGDTTADSVTFTIEAGNGGGRTRKYSYTRDLPLTPSRILWCDYEDGFTVRWNSIDLSSKAKDLTKVKLQLVKENPYTGDETVVSSQYVPMQNGVLEPGFVNFSGQVIRNGSGWYCVELCYQDKNGDDRSSTVGSRYYRMADYLKFTALTPAAGSVAKAEKGDKLTYSYTVANIPQWMRDAGATVESPYVYLYVDGDPANELNTNHQNAYPYTDARSWSGEITLHYTGTHEFVCNVMLKVNGIYSSEWLRGSVTVQVNDKKPPSATDFAFTSVPGDTVVRNGSGFTVSWSTNTAVPTVYLQTYTVADGQWGRAATLGTDTAGGSVEINSATTRNAANTRYSYRIALKDSSGNYSYSDIFTVTWTNDGEAPTKIVLPDRELDNGFTDKNGNFHAGKYEITVPFNYGESNSGTNLSNSYKLTLLNSDYAPAGTLTSSFFITVDKTSIYFRILPNEGWTNTTQHFMLTVKNHDGKGIPTQNVYFDVTWRQDPSRITGVELTGVPSPAAGLSIRSPQAESAEPEMYTAEPYRVTSYEVDFAHSDLDPKYSDTEAFECGNTYYAFFKVTAQNGYYFLDDWDKYNAYPWENDISVTVNGWDGCLCKVREDYIIVAVGLNSYLNCPTSDAGFTDVPKEGNWAHNGIDFCYLRGIMGSTSTSKMTFEPAGTCTRGQIASILYRLAGSPEVGYSAKFTDIAADKWYTDAVIWCSENGIVAGTRNTDDTYSFKPNDKVTREQLAVMLKGFVNYKGGDTSGAADLSGFADANKVTWSKAAVQWAVNEGIISGKANGGRTLLDPQGSATRQEVASIFYRFCNRFYY